jgi:hypothetical protein
MTEEGTMMRNAALPVALVAVLAFTLLSRTRVLEPGGAAEGPGRPAAAPVDPDSFFTPTRLAAGARPPQFVIVSFDGAGSHEKWQYWRSVGDAAGARFTGFLSGVYLVDAAHRNAYRGPGHRAGRSALGYWFDAGQVRHLVDDLNIAWSRGYEIGTHFNGHFCASDRPGADDWSTSDWNDELDQFFGFYERYRSIDHLPDAPALVAPRESVRGARTPCLEGRPAKLLPALRQHGFSYDSSQVATGIGWPPKTPAGLWEFPLAYVPLAGTGSGVVSMDYNFWVKQTGNPPSTRDPIADSDQVLRTYRAMYRAAYDGNRAPLVLGNHFNDWNGGAYREALTAFVKETCRRQDTHCLPYRDVVRWMEAQDPAVLARLQALPPVDTP